MIARTRRPFVRFIVWLSMLSLLLPVHTTRAQTPPPPPQPSPAAGQGSGQGSGTEAPAIDLTNPPWNQTRERIPKEVKDKEKATPITGCPPTRQSRQWEGGYAWQRDTKEEVTYEVTYYDTNTRTTTRVRHTDVFGTWFDGRDGRLTPDLQVRRWEITIEEPGKPKRKITYELNAPEPKIVLLRDGEKRTEKVGKAPPDTRNVAPGDLSDPAPTPAPAPGGQRGSWLYPFSSTRMASVARRSLHSFFGVTGENRAIFSHPFLLTAAATTQERPSSQTPETQERPQHNMKIVTLGRPLENPTVHFEPEPQTTPEEFVENPPMTIWDPTTDSPGPMTATPGPTGIPITSIPLGWINVGSGWASQRVPSSAIRFCSGGDEANELLSEAHRLKQLAETAKQGGPSYWDEQARRHEGNAVTAQSQHRPQLVEPALKRAEEARQIAQELRNRGIPDKPNPKLPKQQLDKLEKERQAAIQKILDEAAELTRRASIM